MIRGLILALALAAAPLPAPAQEGTVIAARRAAQMLAEAAVALADAEEAPDQVAALTATVRAYEAGLAALRAAERQAALRENALRDGLADRRAGISALTGALAAMAPADSPALLVHPGGPLATARAGMMLADTTAALRSEADALTGELEELALVRALRDGAAKQLADGRDSVQRARLGLSQAIGRRAGLPRRHADDPEALAALIAAADTLDSFATGLAAVPLEAAEPPLPAFSDLRGNLAPPLAGGTLLRRFGEDDAAGVSRPGLVLAAPPLALVTAPAAATVRYAGQLLDYGNVIVIEPAPRYLLILAGIGTVYVAEGEVVPEAAPLGLMPDRAGPEIADEDPEGGGTPPQETLYIELREDGAPVDPGEWFAPERG